MNTTQTRSKTAKKSLQTLGNIFHYLEGTILMVELKTGLCHIGKLLSSTSDMNLILVDVVVISPKDKNIQPHCGNNYKLLKYYHQTISLQPQETQQTLSDCCISSSNRNTESFTVQPHTPSSTSNPSPRSTATHAAPILQLVHIRGSKIRYIHFVDHSNSDNKSINHMVQVGMHRERLAKQQYQRGVRK
jgi:small nuclear ribonucleoprotein (snRNP)-like protein